MTSKRNRYHADARIVSAAYPNLFQVILDIRDPEVRAKEMRRAAEEARALGWRLRNGEPVPPRRRYHPAKYPVDEKTEGASFTAMQHTPGPWRLNKRFAFNVEDRHGQTIARVNFEPETYDEAKANAHLIATAPDLLEACEAALNAVVDEDVAEKLRAAIARARGEVSSETKKGGANENVFGC